MNFKNLDLIVIGDKNWPGTVVYLEYLIRNGYQIKKILLCDFYEIQAFKNRLEKILYTVSPRLYKTLCAPSIENFSSLIQDLHEEFQNFFDFKVPLNLSTVNYSKYCPHIEYYKFWNFRDINLLKTLVKDKDSFFLYISGGIVPKTIFDAGLKLIHVHPGYVPYVRGSDGFLWSLRERGKVGYSCFFMNEYIDGGNLIYRHELELHDFSPYKFLIHDYYQSFYRAILTSYDPHLRAQTLIQALNMNCGKIDSNRIIDTSNETGREFFYMHLKLLRKTLLDYVK